MRLLFINPNSTEAMTHSIAETARAATPEHEVLGWTNHAGPPAIQGPADGEAAVVGVIGLLAKAKAQDVDCIVIACFDDTGLAEIRAAAHCPVIGVSHGCPFGPPLFGCDNAARLGSRD